MNSVLSAIFTAVIAGFFSILTLYVKSVLEKRKHFSSSGSAMARHTILMTEIINKMQSGITKVGAIRAIIVKVHNGGKDPHLASPLFTTVVAQAFHPPAEEIETWEKVKIDQHYSQFLNDVTVKGQAKLDPINLPEDHPIRNIYRDSKIGYTLAFYLCGGRYSYCFLAVSFPEGSEESYSSVSSLHRSMKKKVLEVVNLSKSLGLKGPSILS